jgi:Tfp pilus assembly protein PilN
MSTSTPTAVRTATLPRVNLLPAEISEGARFRNLQAAMALAIVVALVVVGALTYLASGDVNDAQDGLTQAQTRGTALQAEVHQYASVPQEYAVVANADAQLQQAMSQEVRYSFILNDLSLRMPAGVWLTNLAISQQVDLPNGTNGAWGSPQLAAIKISGTAINLNDVAGWLDTLARSGEYTDPWVGNATVSASSGTTGQWNFDSTVGVTSKALSNRYTQKAGS